VPVASRDTGAASVLLEPTTRAPANVSCVGDGSPALRETGMGRGEARASQVPGPSSSCGPWSHTLPDTPSPRPLARRGRGGLQVMQPPGHPGSVEVAGPHAPWPARSHTYASPRPFLTPSQGLLPAHAGSPLAGRALHPLDDAQSFMKAWSPPMPFDQPCLVALNFLYSGNRAALSQPFSGALRRVLPPRREARVHPPGEAWLPAGSAEGAGAKMPLFFLSAWRVRGRD
jgi:hypothetical protein